MEKIPRRTGTHDSNVSRYVRWRSVVVEILSMDAQKGDWPIIPSSHST